MDSQENDAVLFDQNIQTVDKHTYCDDKTEILPNDNKNLTYTQRSMKKKREEEERKQKKDEISEKEDYESTTYVWRIDPLWGCPQQYASSNVEDKHVNTAMVYSECCFNRGGTRKLPSSLGQLLRIGSLQGLAWTNRNPTKPCQYVQPNDKSNHGEAGNSSVHQVSDADGCDGPRGDRNDPLILVEKISNEDDRLHVAKSVGMTIINKYPIEECIHSIQQINEYGFNHIVVIGECIYGILFIDCYSRLFRWDSMSDILWFLGDYSQRVKKKSKAGRAAWEVTDDGEVFEIEDPCIYV